MKKKVVKKPKQGRLRSAGCYAASSPMLVGSPVLATWPTGRVSRAGIRVKELVYE